MKTTYFQSAGEIFSPETRMADLIDYNYKLLPVLRRMGINLGFGDDSVEKVCSRAGISDKIFLIICRVHSDNSFIPDDHSIAGLNPSELVYYLRQSHKYFAQREIPVLQKGLQELGENYDPRHRKLLLSFLESYSKELLKHFDYEEKTVFPYIDSLVAGEFRENFTIDKFEKNHSDIDGKLNDLKNIILKYLPSSGCSDHNFELISFIYQLEEDLNSHTMLENRVLVPVVKKLEKNGK